ncbi:MAG: class I SAM-dependent methyltransferase [Nocardioidaceae bacterium]
MVERRRGAIRAAVVWDGLSAAVRSRSKVAGSARQLHIVDLGGGTGGMAVRMAEQGHRITVVDPSPDALAALQRRACEAGVTATVRGVLGDAANLLDAVAPACADVVVCHGVLEVVDETTQALHGMATVLMSGGYLSLVAPQWSAAVLAHVLAGHLADAHTLLIGSDQGSDNSGAVPRRFSRRDLESLVVAAGLNVVDVHGIGVFTDYISSGVADSVLEAAEDLQALEFAASTHPDFMSVATQLHVLAVRS